MPRAHRMFVRRRTYNSERLNTCSTKAETDQTSSLTRIRRQL